VLAKLFASPNQSIQTLATAIMAEISIGYGTYHYPLAGLSVHTTIVVCHLAARHDTTRTTHTIGLF
jgi:hypothetical protein